ncbi:MAG: polyhydroxyalkanoic acid system family protein [Bdellovibrionales bacterium]
MAKFTIDHNVKHPTDKTFEKVQKVLEGGTELKKFDPNIQCDFDPTSKTCHIKGSQFKAELKVAPAGEGSKISVTVDLPLLLLPFKSKISESLSKMFDKHLG